MSESLQSTWPHVDEPVEKHIEKINEGFDAITNHLITPEDGRFQTAYSLLLSGRGQRSWVVPVGDWGTGKTSLGDLMFGHDKRVEISPEFTDAELYGYTNPINRSETIPGKAKGLVPGNPTAYFNEISHLPSTGSIHRLHDLEEIDVNGETVDIRDLAAYMTTNFPDGLRVHELDGAFLSRAAMLMLTGDYDLSVAERIHLLT